MPDFNPTTEEGNSESAKGSKGRESLSPRGPESKKTFIFVGLISLAALFLGFFQIYRHIHSPFQTVLTLDSTMNLTTDHLQKIEDLKNRDTDGDGISDYDELYIYGTSPYLKDTDSDGISDYDEIFVYGTDPNCPEGMDCTGLANTGENLNIDISGESSNDSLISGNATAETLRETLKNSGVPQYILDNISDEELLEIYNYTVSETSDLTANLNSSGLNENKLLDQDGLLTGETGMTTEDLNEVLMTLTPGEIRQLLLGYGLSEEDLNQFDDITLQAIFLQALQET